MDLKLSNRIQPIYQSADGRLRVTRFTDERQDFVQVAIDQETYYYIESEAFKRIWEGAPSALSRKGD